MPFHKAVDLGKIPKKLAGGPAPDLEEAFEVSRATSHTMMIVTYEGNLG